MHQTMKREKWQAKKSGLDKSIKYPVSSTKQKKLIKVKNNLEDFSNTLYEFFLDGFPADTTSPSTPSLKVSPEYPPEYVLRNILTQTSFDLGVIRKAINQRNNPEKSGIPKRLAVLDTLAINALEKFEGLNPVRPYVYFNRDINVRVIPYANALFIGVPMSALTDNGDLPAIAHEVGHHIYKNGKINGQTLDVYFEDYFRNLKDNQEKWIVSPVNRWVLNWLEEIFADLYNVIIAGPVAALTIQDILKDNVTRDLKKDDGVHPPGYLRPYVTIEALKQVCNIDNDQNPLISKLTKNWEKAREARDLANLMPFMPAGEKKINDAGSITVSGPVEIKEDHAKGLIAKVVKEMWEKLKGNFTEIEPWSQRPNGDGDLESIYKSFDSYIDSLVIKDTDIKIEGRKDEWDPNTKCETTPKDWINYIQTIKWSKIFADTRPVSGPE